MSKERMYADAAGPRPVLRDPDAELGVLLAIYDDDEWTDEEEPSFNVWDEVWGKD